LPFGLGPDVDSAAVDAALADLGPLVEDLAMAERSLDALAADVERLGPTTQAFSAELGLVADELRASATDLDRLATDVADTRVALGEPGTNGGASLWFVRLLLIGLFAAIVIGRLPDAVGA
jgi:ABC-type transporter Mla subunit MlaD